MMSGSELMNSFVDWYASSPTQFRTIMWTLLAVYTLLWFYIVYKKPPQTVVKIMTPEEATEALYGGRLPEAEMTQAFVAKHINTLADKHPALLVRQISGHLRTERNRRAEAETHVHELETIRVINNDRLRAAVTSTWYDMGLHPDKRAEFLELLTRNYKELEQNETSDCL